MNDDDYHSISEDDYNKAWNNIRWLILYRRRKTIELIITIIVAIIGGYQ